MKRNPFVIVALAVTVALVVIAGASHTGSAPGVATCAAHAQAPDEMAEGCKAKVDPDKCVGCGRCVKAAPEGFAWDAAHKVATVKPDAPAAAIERGIKACPIDGAITR